MNEELISKKRSEGLQSLIKTEDLQDLASLSEIIATEVIKYKPGTDSYMFIYQLLQAMAKTREAMACVNELGENELGRAPSLSIQHSNLGYYTKESMDNYFRSGLKKPLSAVPGCSGCNIPLHDNEVPSLAGAGFEAQEESSYRRNTACSTQTTEATLQHYSWEKRQTWHSLLNPESVGKKHESTDSQDSKKEDCAAATPRHKDADEVNSSSDDPSVAPAEFCDDAVLSLEEMSLEPLNDDPKPPNTTPRSE